MAQAKAIKKNAAQHDLFNRIHSIASDEAFVRKVAEGWYDGRFEVVPNQRCGNWYCDPSSSSKVYAYFKSTDGHTSNWDFNLRRSNLPLAKYIEDRRGLILVDSTRRGKRMPDGLSKTVPIWCAVINLALELRRRRTSEGLLEGWDTELYTPPNIVSPSEKAQIESRLRAWAEALESSVLPLPNLTKPLRPFFIHPSTSRPPSIPQDAGYTPIICLSASRWVNPSTRDGEGDEIPLFTSLGPGRTVGFEYVPGGGDDDELWGRGLTPAVFHANKKRLLEVDREGLPDLVDELVATSKTSQLGNINHIDRLNLDDPPPSEASSSESLVPLPQVSITPRATLYVDMGPTISSTSFTPPSIDPKTCFTLLILSIDKPPTDGVYIISEPDGSRHSILLLPDPKSHGREYMRSLSDLVAYLRKFTSTVEQQADTPMIIRSGLPSDLNNITTSPFTPLSLPSDPSTTLKSRKDLIPILLVLLCTFPPDSLDGEDESGIDKATIARHLHSLISLWPDGNPPRAALKRVNEFLMGEIKRV